MEYTSYYLGELGTLCVEYNVFKTKRKKILVDIDGEKSVRLSVDTLKALCTQYQDENEEDRLDLRSANVWFDDDGFLLEGRRKIADVYDMEILPEDEGYIEDMKRDGVYYCGSKIVFYSF